MEIRVLGCSGGIGGRLRSTSYLVDHDILIDAGTGVGELTLDEMAGLRHIFLTHCHLDHIACLPLLIDSVFERIREPMVIHAQEATLEALRKHIFNWMIWPDFSRLPSEAHPVIRFEVMAPGERVTLQGRHFDMIPVNHAVPTVAYRVECDSGVFAFSGDTTTNDTLWAGLNAGARLDLLIVECAFADHDLELSRKAFHYCPTLIAQDLRKLQHRPRIYITHNKPGHEHAICAQVRLALPDLNLHCLTGGEVFKL